MAIVVPSVTPKNFMATQVNATSVKFVWDPVDGLLINGRLRGYKVSELASSSANLRQCVVFKIKAWSTSKLHKRSSRDEWEVTVSHFHTFAVLSGFEPMHRYAAHAMVLNSKFEGPPSAVIEFTTPEGRKWTYYHFYQLCKFLFCR